MYAVEATITFHLTNLQLPNLYSLESRARAGFVLIIVMCLLTS